MKKYLAGFWLAMLLAACSSDNQVATNGGVTPTSKSHLYLGTISTIPIGLDNNSSLYTAASTRSASKQVAKTPKSVGLSLNNSGNSGSVTYITVVNNLDKTANLENIQVKGDAAVEAKPSQYINTTACKKVVPHGMCNIILNPPNQNGSFLLTVKYDVGSYSQMVSYQKDMPPTNGFILNNSQNMMVTKQIPERTAFSVPFVPAQDLSALKVSTSKSGFVNTRVICNGGVTNKGNLCTILGEVLPATPDGAVGVTLSGVLRDTGEEVSTTFSIMINNEQAANLVTTGANVVINGNSSQIVTVLNNGNETATDIAFNVDNNGIDVGDANQCTSLGAGSSCEVVITATGNQNFQGQVNITWNGATKTGSTKFNVVYIASATSPGIEMTSSGNLLYTIEGDSSNYSITIKNNGGVTLNNITPVNVTAINPFFTYTTTGLTNPCALDGNQSLASTESCAVQIHYQPTSAEPQAAFDFTVTAKYTGVDGETLSYSPGRMSIDYSAFSQPAVLVSNPMNWEFEIRADNVDSATESFAITNSGQISTKVEGIQLVSGDNVTVISGPEQCIAGESVLQPESGNTCYIYVKYGPKAAVEEGENHLLITYLPTPVTPLIDAANLDLTISYKASAAALIKVSNITATGQTSGDGSLASALTFYNSPGNQLTTTITYLNDGTADADGFNIDLTNLRIGMIVDPASTCGIANNTSVLESGDTCQVILKAVDDRLYNYLAISGALDQAILGYSYTDVNTGFNQELEPFYSGFASNQVAITAVPFASVTTTGGSVAASTAAQSVDFYLDFTSSGGDALMYPIKITLLGTGGAIYADDVNYCTISSQASGQFCTIPMKASAGTPAGTYSFQFRVSPTGNDSVGIVQTLDVVVE